MDTRLLRWMKAHGYSNATLGEALGVGREVVWAYVSGRRPVSSRFKWLFASRFGGGAAAEVFDLELSSMPEATAHAEAARS